MREQTGLLPPCQAHWPLPAAYLVDVGQCALTRELHCVHLHGRARLDDLILIAQGSHIEHEGLGGTDELIVHLAQEKAAKQNKNGQRLSSQLSFIIERGLIVGRTLRKYPCHFTLSQQQLEK